MNDVKMAGYKTMLINTLKELKIICLRHVHERIEHQEKVIEDILEKLVSTSQATNFMQFCNQQYKRSH
jgi:hypothetical protein